MWGNCEFRFCILTSSFLKNSRCKWEEALNAFEALHKSTPDCYACQMYIERIHAFMKSPPDKNWDGVYTHLVK